MQATELKGRGVRFKPQNPILFCGPHVDFIEENILIFMNVVSSGFRNIIIILTISLFHFDLRHVNDMLELKSNYGFILKANYALGHIHNTSSVES